MPDLKYGFAAFLTVLSLQACGESRTPSVYGAPCGADVPCGGDLACVSAAAFPGGYCSLDCASVECGMGAICDRERAPALCLAICTAASDCRDGYQCWRGACRPGCDLDPTICDDGATCGADGACVGVECTIDDDCGAGRRCASGTCVDRPPPVDGGGDGALGDPCAVDAACASGICLPADRGGVCTSPCTTSSGCIDEGVPFDASCAPVSRAGGLATLCIPYNPSGGGLGSPCSSDAQCESSTCSSGQCTDTCGSVSDCITGQICGATAWGGGTFTGCGYDATTGIIEIDLGTHDLGAGFGTAPLAFATPPGSVSVTIRAQTLSGDPLPLSFYDVQDPTGATIFDLEEIYAWRDTPERWIPGRDETAIAMLVPNATTERLVYVPGRHEVRILAMSRTMGDTGSASVRVSALVKRTSTGTVSAGALDMDVFMVGVGVTAAAAPGNTRVQAALNRFRALLAPTGITVGDIAYHDVTAAQATTYQVIDSTDGAASELAGLFRLSAGRTGNRLSIFLVRQVNGGRDGFNTLGIAGGIPGPPGIHGSPQSGVVVAFDSGVVGASGALAGHVMAHEVGHFMGLYHTTESVRACGPGEEPSMTCLPFGSTDTIGDTTRGNTTYLMHWSLVGSGDNTAVTGGQSFVLLRSALVR